MRIGGVMWLLLAACTAGVSPIESEGVALDAGQAKIHVDREQQDDEQAEQRSDTVPQDALGDDALRLLLFDAYVAAQISPLLQVSHPSGEAFTAQGVYFEILGRIHHEGTFDIANGLVCVDGHSIDRLCRYVVPVGDGTYAFVDSSDGSRAIMIVTKR